MKIFEIILDYYCLNQSEIVSKPTLGLGNMFLMFKNLNFNQIESFEPTLQNSLLLIVLAKKTKVENVICLT